MAAQQKPCVSEFDLVSVIAESSGLSEGRPNPKSPERILQLRYMHWSVSVSVCVSYFIACSMKQKCTD